MDCFPPHVTADYLRFYENLSEQYLSRLGGKKPYADAVLTVNKLNSIDDLQITSNEELILEVEELIDSLQRWVREEGTDLTKHGEVDAQINIAQRLRIILLEKFGKDDVKLPRIERETQAVDGTRTDFYVYYGFLGPILIELKLSTHADLLIRGDQTKKESFISMKKYMSQFKAPSGILLVYMHSSTDTAKFEKIMANTKRCYEQLANVRVARLVAKS